MSFSPFPLSHSERIAIAIQDLLLADANFSSWLGTRVYRPIDPIVEPDAELPMALVQIVDESYPPKISDRTEVIVTVQVVFVYEDERDVAGPTDPTPYSLAHDFTRLLQQDADGRCLKVPRYSDQPLIERIVAVRTIPYDSTLKPQVAHDIDLAAWDRAQRFGLHNLEIEPIDLVRYLPIGVQVAYSLDRSTWSKAGFTP